MIITIDRIEGDFAVCETESKKEINVPVSIFENAKEGQSYLLTKCDNPLKKKINKLMNEAFK